MSNFRALRNPNFRLFWSGNFLSNIGTWMQNVAQGWLVLTSPNSAFWLGVVGFAGSIPFLLFTLFGGVIADRVNKRRLLLVTQTVMMLLAFLLAGAHVAQGRSRLGGGGARLPQRHGHGHERAQLPGAGAAPGEARRPHQRHRAQLRAVQHVAHPGPHAGRLRHGPGRRGGQLLPQRRQLSRRAVGADTHCYPQESALATRACYRACAAGLRTCGRAADAGADLDDGGGELLGIPFLTFIPYFAKIQLHAGESGLGWLLAASGSGAVLGRD
jgi:hypothetical protein